MVSIASALEHVRHDLPRLIESHTLAALAACPEFLFRVRRLDPLTTLLLLVTQVMHATTALSHLRHPHHLAGLDITASALCKARQRLPLTLLERVCQCVAAELLPQGDEACRWRGHRIWWRDGSSLWGIDARHPRVAVPLWSTRPAKPRLRLPHRHPHPLLLLLCSAAGFITKAIALPLRSGEATHLPRLHEAIGEGDVLIYDRAGSSYTHLALLMNKGLHGVMRMHQKRIVDFRDGRGHAGQMPKRKRAGEPRSE